MSGPASIAGEALLTDLYELTMLAAYFDHDMNESASFEFFVRALPEGRNFLIATGLAQVCEFLENLQFTREDRDWLASLNRFSPAFLRSLSDFRFTGEVHALPEGTFAFADEPLLRITAPLPQAQLVESRVMNLLHFQTLIASKAVRSRLAAPDALLVDFGLRRAHGREAALMSARASYIAGFSGTSNVLAGRAFNIPIFGTMAHSFVQACDSESQAFERYATTHTRQVTFLIDTYDTEQGARHVVALMPKLRARNVEVEAVRLDSGNLAKHARAVRSILDEGGCHDIRIFASGNLDEHSVAHLREINAPIDGFGVGTRMNTSADAPFLDCAYKLETYAAEPKRKRSTGKATWPGAKQIHRRSDARGKWLGDTLALQGEPAPGTPLMVPVMKAGRRIQPPETLQGIRERVSAQLAALPEALSSLTHHAVYPVDISAGIRLVAARVDDKGAA